MAFSKIWALKESLNSFYIPKTISSSMLGIISKSPIISIESTVVYTEKTGDSINQLINININSKLISVPITSEIYDNIAKEINKEFIKIGVKVYDYCGHDLTIIDLDEGSCILAYIKCDSKEEAAIMEFPVKKIVIKELIDDIDYTIIDYWRKTRESNLNLNPSTLDYFGQL